MLRENGAAGIPLPEDCYTVAERGLALDPTHHEGMTEEGG